MIFQFLCLIYSLRFDLLPSIECGQRINDIREGVNYDGLAYADAEVNGKRGETFGAI